MKSLGTYIQESRSIILLNNETFYEDYVNNRTARNGIKPQIYLTGEQLEWLNDYTGIDDYVLFGDNTNEVIDIKEINKNLKEVSTQKFGDNDIIKVYSKNDYQVFISYHDDMWCMYAPKTFYETILKNVQFTLN